MAHNSRWIRINLDWSSSDWLVVLSSEARLCWVEFLCHVKQNGSGGSAAKRHPLTLARKWGVGEESVSQMLRAAENDGAIVVTEQNWEVANWKEYQGNNAERMAAWRANKKTKSDVSEPDVTVTERNVDVTKRDVTVYAYVDADVDVVNKKKTASSKKPKPPTLADCESYALSEFGLNGTFASQFFSKHSAAGWQTTKGEPIQDWQKYMRGKVNSMTETQRDQFKPKPPKEEPDLRYVHR